MGIEASSALVGGLLVVLTLIVCYIAVTTFDDPITRHCGPAATTAAPGADAFMNRHIYRPACGNQWISLRSEACRGQTRGHMPSIEEAPLPEGTCIPPDTLMRFPVHACCTTPACGTCAG